MANTTGGNHSGGRLRSHQAGERIGERYHVGKLLGQGGFGSVYEVEDGVLKIQMACKEMDLLEAPPGLSGNRESFLESFLREATALKTLHHPNIPPADYLVVPYGRWVCVTCGEANAESDSCPSCRTAAVRVDHRHYVLMRFLDGDTLEARFAHQGRPLTWENARGWFLQVCSAVGELHHQGLLHRDIKPENVLLERNSDRAYLLDLGLVKVVDPMNVSAGMGSKTRVLSTKTQAIGTPGYASPELYRGQAEPASDIFALGMMLYWALTDRNPGDEAERTEILQQTPVDFNPRVPQVVSDAIVKAIKVRPKDRYPTVADFVEALSASAAAPVAASDTPTVTIHRPVLPSTDTLTPTTVLPLADVPPPAQPIWPWVAGLLAFVLSIAGGVAVGLGLFPWSKGSIGIETDPVNAEVWHGSKLVGHTPCEVADLVAGTVTLRIVLAGYETQTIQPKVEAGKRGSTNLVLTKTAPPVPTTTPAPVETPPSTPPSTPAPTPTPAPTASELANGSVQIESDPAGAKILTATGKELGKTPLLVPDLPAGPMTVNLVLDGYDKEEVNFTIESGAKITRSIRLTATAPAAPAGLTYVGHKNAQGFYEYRNEKDGSVLVLIPARTYMMGSDATMQSFSDERPRHKVTLPAYYLGRTEVTLAQYQKYCEATGHKAAPKPSCPQDGTHPVVNVSFEDAQAYLKWAGLRLPTEAEWELAAQGPNSVGARYPWGAEEPSDTRANFGDTSVSRPVGSSPLGASGFGCLDLSGNVWEWCADWYGEYYAKSPEANPQGPEDGKRRIARGGGYGLSRATSLEYMRSGCRWSFPPNALYPNLGFRVALSAPR